MTDIKVLSRDEVKIKGDLITRRDALIMSDSRCAPALLRFGASEALRMMDAYEEPALSIGICPQCGSSERSQRTCGHAWHSWTGDKPYWDSQVLCDVPATLNAAMERTADLNRRLKKLEVKYG